MEPTLQILSDPQEVGKTASDSDQNTAAAPPAYQARHSSPFALISFHSLDHIRFIHLPELEVDRLHECVRQNWASGVSGSDAYNASVELKLKSSPWGSSYAGKPKVTKLIQAMLAELYDMGWKPEQAIVLCKKSNQKDTLLLRRTHQPTSPASWLSISFDQYDIVTVHDGPLELRQLLIARFSAQEWSIESTYIEDRMEIRLKKQYWMSNGEDTVRARLMLLEIVEALDLFGFRIYASLKLTSENDSLFCVKEV